MRVIPLHRTSNTDYSCICYWILGDSSLPEDRNTLIDTGSTNLANLGYFMREMAAQSKGIGKIAVEQVILTHAHYDHAGGLPGIVTQFNPVIYSLLPVPGRREPALDGLHVRIGDQDGVILHTPGHSEDSVCVYLPATGTIFSGDTLFHISDDTGSYPRAYLESLERLCTLEIKSIYPGHGMPVSAGADAFIRSCLDHVGRSVIVD